MWRFLRNDLTTAWRTARARLFIEIAIIAIALPCGLMRDVPQIYLAQSTRAARLAQIAAVRGRSAGSEEEREFARREAAWYRAQSREIYWRAIGYALRPGYGPNGRDEQSDAELTIRDLAARERLDRHGFGWSRYQWLAENHSRRAEELSEFLREIKEAKSNRSCFDLSSLKRELDWHSRLEQYYLAAASRPWEPLQDNAPNP
jgi:hypothetical protein